MTRSWPLVALLALSVSACGDPTELVVEPDAGAFDAGEVDAGEVDAGGVDAGGLDAGGLDAGAIDAGDLDAGAIDAGDLDAGAIDAGDLDAGAIDAGDLDAGDVDAGDLDAGAPDAGAPDAGVDAGLPVERIATLGYWPTVALTSDRLYVAYRSVQPERAVVSVLDKSTNTWSHVSFPGSTTRPVVRVDSTGKAYFLDSTEFGALVFKESTDHGATWTNVSLTTFGLVLPTSGVLAARFTADLVIDAANRPHILAPRDWSNGTYQLSHLWKNTSWSVELVGTDDLLTAPRGVAHPNGSVDVVYTADTNAAYTYEVRRAHWANGTWSFATLTSGGAETPQNDAADSWALHPVASANGTLLTTWVTDQARPDRQTVWTWAGGSPSVAKESLSRRAGISLALEPDVTQRPLLVFAFDFFSTPVPDPALELLRQAPDGGWTTTTLTRGSQQALAVDGSTLLVVFKDRLNQLQLARVPLP